MIFWRATKLRVKFALAPESEVSCLLCFAQLHRSTLILITNVLAVLALLQFGS